MTPATHPLRRRTDLAELRAQVLAAKTAALDLSTCRAIAHTTATRPLTFIEWLDGQSR